jgi:electron transfer flavoprotein alpha subunit
VSILVVIEHDRGVVPVGSFEALTAARELAAQLGTVVDAVVLGPEAGAVAAEIATAGASTIHTIAHDVIGDYGPEAYASAVAQLVEHLAPSAVVACGTSRGNEVLAHLSAMADAAFAANVVSVHAADGDWTVTRQQWGGSLLEDATLAGGPKYLSFAHHTWQPAAADAAPADVVAFDADIDPALARTVITGRTVLEAGVTLATAPVVVSGGRAMKNAENFAMLEELAGLLGGRVGCSRAVTNNGWRNHADQVGQTGTRIAPEVYLACGISGATQHWVGAMGSKNIIAINLDKEANLVTKSGHAVIADLFEIVPAIIAEVKQRKGVS